MIGDQEDDVIKKETKPYSVEICPREAIKLRILTLYLELKNQPFLKKSNAYLRGEIK